MPPHCSRVDVAYDGKEHRDDSHKSKVVIYPLGIGLIRHGVLSVLVFRYVVMRSELAGIAFGQVLGLDRRDDVPVFHDQTVFQAPQIIKGRRLLTQST